MKDVFADGAVKVKEALQEPEEDIFDEDFKEVADDDLDTAEAEAIDDAVAEELAEDAADAAAEAVDEAAEAVEDAVEEAGEAAEEIAEKFEMVGAIEREHEERYKKLLSNIMEGIVFSREGDMIWQCSNCGHIVIGKQAPEICPVCSHPQSYFELAAQNF